MAHSIDWLIPDLVLRASLQGNIMADEVQLIADNMYTTIENTRSDHLVHLIIDLRMCSMGDKVWNYSRLNLQRNKRNGWSIIIGDSRLSGLVIAIFSKILNITINYSPSPATAIRFIIERDLAVATYLQSHEVDLS